MAIFRGNGVGGFDRQADIPLQGDPILAAVADFDNDGLSDIAVGGVQTGQVEVFVQTNPDVTAPVTAATVLGSQITLTATDDLSGVDKTFYAIDGGAQQAYSGPFNLPASGAHSITFWSVDKAGNPESANALTGIGNDTYLTVTNISGMVGQKKNLSARLRRTGSNLALPGQTITFKLDGNVYRDGHDQRERHSDPCLRLSRDDRHILPYCRICGRWPQRPEQRDWDADHDLC